MVENEGVYFSSFSSPSLAMLMLYSFSIAQHVYQLYVCITAMVLLLLLSFSKYISNGGSWRSCQLCSCSIYMLSLCIFPLFFYVYGCILYPGDKLGVHDCFCSCLVVFLLVARVFVNGWVQIKMMIGYGDQGVFMVDLFSLPILLLLVVILVITGGVEKKCENHGRGMRGMYVLLIPQKIGGGVHFLLREYLGSFIKCRQVYVSMMR